ncbi:diguanylate cyclase (GGDEF)-like protein/PAS domain S-box-containing protein [Pseudorhizobium tarimense]|uniref:Diguanylate cyclase (GGDEF)-like protein/PAS domain S-box-containing protein n=1 Tax=Pseudorhizobium tarimense TaxID=1079109 RepID=A0ABV2H0M2_9HYPH|nr:diguanylate cyclase [Pseudorhizobium tarimense]MCJ8517429.1 diguanylate cyclase [Pseudorhizobium tarimense]
MESPVSHDVHLHPDSVSLEELCTRLLRVSTKADISEALLVINELNLHSLINQFPDYIYVKDRRSRFVLANSATARAHGFDGATSLLGKTDFDFLGREAAEELFLAEQTVMTTGEPLADIEHKLEIGGGLHWFQSTKTALRNPEGEIVGLIGLSRDITERKRQDGLRRGHARLLDMIARGQPLERVLHGLVELVEEQLDGITAAVLLTEDGTERLRNGAAPGLPEAYCQRIDGMAIGPRAGSCGTAAWRREPVIVSDVANDPLWEDFRDLPLQFGFRSCWSTPIISAEDILLGTFALYSNTVREPTPRERELTAMATDLAGIAIERTRTEERIRHMAHHDALTGLPNRSLFWAQFNRAIVEARREQRRVTATYIDLDNFKQINDTLGHAAGDEVLRTLADRLGQCIRASDLLVRLGGDEFAIVFSNPRHEQNGDVVLRLQEFRATLSTPVAIDGADVHVTCSMGVAFFPEDGETPEALLAKADKALYAAKSGGRDQLQIWRRPT